LNQRAYVVREDQTGIMNQLFSFLDVIPEGVIALTAYGTAFGLINPSGGI
jgi:hypothetical protein